MDSLKCPACGADAQPGRTSLDGWDDELASGRVFVDFTCARCGAEYTEVYVLADREVTYEPGKEGA